MHILISLKQKQVSVEKIVAYCQTHTHKLSCFNEKGVEFTANDKRVLYLVIHQADAPEFVKTFPGVGFRILPNGIFTTRSLNQNSKLLQLPVNECFEKPMQYKVDSEKYRQDLLDVALDDVSNTDDYLDLVLEQAVDALTV